MCKFRFRCLLLLGSIRVSTVRLFHVKSRRRCPDAVALCYDLGLYMSDAVSVRIELDRFLFRRRVSIVNENRDSDSGSQACLQSSRDQLVGQLKLTSTPRDQSRATSQHQQSSSLRHRKVTNSKSCGMTPAVSRTDRATEMYEFSTFDGEPSAKSDGCDSQAMCVSDTELSLNRDGDDIALAFRNIISRKLVSSHCTR